MKKRDPDTYLIVPAGIFGRLTTIVWTLFKWLLALTCLAVVGFVLLQIVRVLNDVSHHRTPAALQHRTPSSTPSKGRSH